MGLDLSSVTDFAKATMTPLSDIAGVLSEFTGRDPSQWDIREGSYNGVLFHVFESKSSYSGALSTISENGGRRKVKYQFPYQDGQTTDDLGRKPETFEFDIVIHGQNYMVGFNRLMKELNSPKPGILVHPVRGNLRVVPEDYSITHSSSQRKALSLKVTFVEHNFDVDFKDRSFEDKSVKGALTKALETFARIQKAILNVAGATIFAQSVINKITTALENYSTGYGLSLQRMNVTFNGGTSADIPTLIPTNSGGTGTPGSGTNFPSVTSPSDPFASVPTDVLSDTTSTAIAASQITKEVNKLRQDLESVLGDLGAGLGSLEFYDDILALKETAVFLQDVLEKGLSSSQSRIVQYVTPRLMSLREIAFENGLSPDRADELDLLNPSLLSVNFVSKGTSLKVPVS